MKKMKLRAKILLMMGLLIGVNMLASFYAISGLGRIGTEVEVIAESNIPAIEALTHATVHQLEQAIWFERALRFGVDNHLKGEHLHKARQEFGDHGQKVEKWVHEALLYTQEAERRNSKQSGYAYAAASSISGKGESFLNTILEQHRQYEEHVQQVFSFQDNGEFEKVTKLAAQVEQEEESLDHAFEQFLVAIEKQTEKSVGQVEHDEKITIRGLYLATTLALLIGLAISFVGSSRLTGPIEQGVDFAKRISEGDLTGQLNITQNDEIGLLADSLNTMSQNLRKTIQEIAVESDALTSSSSALSAISTQLSANSEQTTNSAETVAAAADQLSSNMDSVAAASEEASVNINLMATSADEMSSTIKDVAANTDKTKAITETAVVQANEACAMINELGSAAQEIGKVTETITEISEQTNLLALNATIEAARAGEAGKGFAVVANEIKDLAKQTSDATAEIKDKIVGIQSASDGSVVGINQITSIINEINENVTSVAVTVDEQAAVTQEIADNVSQASQGIQEVNENVAQASQVTGEVARDITEVGQASDEVSTSGKQLGSNARDLSALAKKLNTMVNTFKV